jgi:ferulate-5-hydroxylase
VGRRGFDRRLRMARGALDRFIDKIVDEHARRGKNAADPDADLVDGLLAFLADADPASGKNREGGKVFSNATGTYRIHIHRSVLRDSC